MHHPNRGFEENELYDLLVALIEKFEQEYYLPKTASKPDSMLLFLIDQHNLQAADLSKVFGSEVIATDVITNQVEFSKE